MWQSTRQQSLRRSTSLNVLARFPRDGRDRPAHWQGGQHQGTGAPGELKLGTLKQVPSLHAQSTGRTWLDLAVGQSPTKNGSGASSCEAQGRRCGEYLSSTRPPPRGRQPRSSNWCRPLQPANNDTSVALAANGCDRAVCHHPVGLPRFGEPRHEVHLRRCPWDVVSHGRRAAGRGRAGTDRSLTGDRPSAPSRRGTGC